MTGGATERSNFELGRLAALGVSTWDELVFYLSRRYKDYTRHAQGFAAGYSASNGAEPAAAPGGRVCLRLTVLGAALFDREARPWSPGSPGRAFRASFKVRDEAGQEGSFAAFGRAHRGRMPWPRRARVPGRARLSRVGERRARRRACPAGPSCRCGGAHLRGRGPAPSGARANGAFTGRAARRARCGAPPRKPRPGRTRMSRR